MTLPDTPISIRLGRKTDVPTLLRIYSYYVAHSTATLDYSMPSRSFFLSKMKPRQLHYPFIVMESLRAGVIGYAYASAVSPRAGYQWTAETAVYLNPDYCSRRLGHRLYAALLRLLQAQGFFNAYACITADNEPSLHLHRRMGFVQEGLWHHSAFKAGRWLDVAWLNLSLAALPDAPRPVTPISEMADARISELLNQTS